MMSCRIVFELWTKIVSGGQKNCAYLKNTSIPNLHKYIIIKLFNSGVDHVILTNTGMHMDCSNCQNSVMTLNVLLNDQLGVI